MLAAVLNADLRRGLSVGNGVLSMSMSMKAMEINGTKHAYQLTAPTELPEVLVFVHGWMLSGRYWQPLIDRLAPNYQCLSYDLRGFGDSQILPGDGQVPDYGPTAYAKDLEVLLEKLDISGAWLIGHSLGGTIALLAASLMPEKVKGVICVNAGGGVYLKEEFDRFRNAGQKIVKFRPRWLSYVRFLDWVFARSQVYRPIDIQWGKQRVVDFFLANEEAALGSLLDSTTEEEVASLPKIVSQIKQPVYFIGGAEDKVMEFKYVRHLASFHWLFEEGEKNAIAIPQCGHLAMVEQTDVLADMMVDILNC